MEYVFILVNAFAMGITYLYGSLGEILTEKSGHLNLGIPGIMCVGSATGCVMLQILHTHNVSGFIAVVLGILFAFIGGGIMGALYSFFTVSLKANQNVTGLAMTTFGVGLTNFIMHSIKSDYLLYKKAFKFPFAAQKNTFQYLGIMVYIALIIAVLMIIFLKKTRTGLNLRSVGENPATADAAGINVSKYRYLATIIGSGIAGLGGLFYIMDYAGSAESYLSVEAFGWLSVALVIFSTWNPVIAIFGSFLFGLLSVASAYLPSYLHFLTMASNPFLKMLPYAVTIIVLIISSIRYKRENQPPEKLGLNYFREDR